MTQRDDARSARTPLTNGTARLLAPEEREIAIGRMVTVDELGRALAVTSDQRGRVDCERQNLTDRVCIPAVRGAVLGVRRAEGESQAILADEANIDLSMFASAASQRAVTIFTNAIRTGRYKPVRSARPGGAARAAVWFGLNALQEMTQVQTIGVAKIDDQGAATTRAREQWLRSKGAEFSDLAAASTRLGALDAAAEHAQRATLCFEFADEEAAKLPPPRRPGPRPHPLHGAGGVGSFLLVLQAGGMSVDAIIELIRCATRDWLPYAPLAPEDIEDVANLDPDDTGAPPFERLHSRIRTLMARERNRLGIPATRGGKRQPSARKRTRGGMSAAAAHRQT